MKRAVIWSLLAAVVLATLVGLWFVQNFEQVPSTRWELPQPEARRNPYLAVERLFAQLGRPLHRLNSPRSLDELAAGGVLILDDNRRREVDPARAERLLDWVRRGGYLIVAAESDGDDPLLAKLGLSPYRASKRQCASGEGGKAGSTVADRLEAPAPIELSLPGDDTRYRFKLRGWGLCRSSLPPSWQAGSSHNRPAVLHFDWGRGQITVFDELAFLTNRELGEYDHAELIWALLQRYQPQGELRLASRMELPTLWQWLLESAWMVLISAAVLIALWLWRIVPRFGGVLATPVSERRDLAQHLAAIGRSVWREGGMAHWLAVVRQALNQRLALRHPQLALHDAAEQHAALAKLTGGQAKDIGSALTSGQAQTPEQFTRAMQTLQRLDQGL